MLLELVLTFFVVTAAVDAAGENVREFRSICVFYQLLTQSIPEHKAVSGSAANPTQEDPAAKVGEIVRHIIKLNLTTVQSEIAAILADNTPEGSHEKVKDNAAKKWYFDRLEKAEFENMKADFKEITTDETNKDFRTKYGLPLSQERKLSLQKAFAHLTKTALDIRDEHKNIMERLDKVRKEARKHALKALYGAEYANSIGSNNKPSQPWEDFPDKTKFPWADKTGRDTICKKPDGTAGQAGQAIAQDAVCLCVGQQASSNIYCKSPNLGTNNQINSAAGGQAKAAANWQDYAKECNIVVAPGTLQLAPTALQEAISAFYNQLGKNAVATGDAPNSATGSLHKAAQIFGYYAYDSRADPGCETPSPASTAAQGKGACIDYTTLLTTKAGIPWVTAVRELSTKLLEADKIARESQMTIAKAQQLQNQMEALLLMGSLQKSADATKTQVTVDEQNKCAKFNGNETDCTTNGCDYDKTKKECKPKARKEITQAGTGGSGATAGCARHGTDKTAYENGKTGDEQNCAFIKGKHGQDDKEKEKCRNVICLLNKNKI